MLKDIAEAMLGRRPFDLVIRNVQIVNVFSASIVSGSIGIVNGHIAGVFGPEEALDSRRSIDGGNAYALPGFVDSHMHLESSMLTPEHFAQVALSCGTTTVCADPHEIANVLGIEGVRGLADACRSLPLRVLLTAPSTIPSAPGLEDSGFDVQTSSRCRACFRRSEFRRINPEQDCLFLRGARAAAAAGQGSGF